ncbi:replication terminator protein [Weissella viridescens]|uniref:replication terminator protein n=1 Tax=Weissella viridescens TaxID=1629 RepID=UPI001D098EA7|nr:replication terminator protein [Weissella viridescens]MCB6839668.1 replication terminator protein [Weissella viridescens]MCB6846400.1 replication terminator protein [Weissella viridescens]
MKNNGLNLAEFADGALVEDINREYQKVAENLLDPNAKDVVRKLIIELTFKPGEDGQTVGTSGIVKSKLAPAEDKITTMLIGRNGMGNVEMAELRSSAKGQTTIDPDTGQLLDDTGEPLKGENTQKIDFLNK